MSVLVKALMSPCVSRAHEASASLGAAAAYPLLKSRWLRTTTTRHSGPIGQCLQNLQTCACWRCALASDVWNTQEPFARPVWTVTRRRYCSWVGVLGHIRPATCKKPSDGHDRGSIDVPNVSRPIGPGT